VGWFLNQVKVTEIFVRKLVDKWLGDILLIFASVSEAVPESKLRNYISRLGIHCRGRCMVVRLIDALIYNKYGPFGLESAPKTQLNGEVVGK